MSTATDSSAPDAIPSAPASRSLRWPALGLGLRLGRGLGAATPWHNAYLQGTSLAGGHFPLAPFFISVVLVLVTASLARATGTRPLLSGAEHLAIWALMTVVSGFGWTGLARTFLVNITTPTYFASAGNHWEEVFGGILPEAWHVTNATCVKAMYNGLEGGRGLSTLEILHRIPWDAWVTPLATWGVFLLLAFWVMLCLTSILGKQWVVNERVNFPLMRTPQLLDEHLEAGTLGGLFTDKHLLLGLSLPVFLHAWNGLSAVLPSIPIIPTVLMMGDYFPKHGVLSGFHKLKLSIYPAFIGFAFLTTRQISLSFWVFFLLAGLMGGMLATMGLQPPPAALGLTFGPSIASPEEAQTIGAFLVFFLFLVWLGRRHLRLSLRCAVRGRAAVFGELCAESLDARDNVSWMHPGVAVWGTVLGLACLTGWAGWFGLPLGATLAFLLVGFMTLVVVSRLVCQGGVPYYAFAAAPMDGLLGLLGTSFFGPAGILGLAVMQKVLFLDVRESLMPSLFHAAKAGENVRGRGRLFAALCLALTLGAAVALGAMLVLAHKYGMRDLSVDWAQRTSISMYETAQQLMEVGQGARPWVITYAGVGAVVMLLLVACYYKLPWWPIHPLGYLAAYGTGMTHLWFCFLAGWLCNHLILRYGGAALFRRVRNVFIGLIIGDFLMGGAWAIVGLFTDIRYHVFPL
ncbi:MAG: hypothetical protein LDL30_07300 [Desulfovibrio sp.]|nr:hypothetical protein [Desulfovibrio sp.]